MMRFLRSRNRCGTEKSGKYVKFHSQSLDVFFIRFTSDPVIVNIRCFHTFMAPSGLPFAFVVAVLALFLFWRYRGNFAGLVKNSPAGLKTPPQPSAARTEP